MKDVPVKSVKKALDLLSILLFEDIACHGIDLSSLASKLNIPVNTTHNLLKTMSICGFVTQNDNSKYLIGPKCKQIGMINELKDERNANMINAQMQKLSKDLQENAVFTILAGGRRITTVICEPEEQLIKIDSARFDQNCSIYQLPTGRVLTAFASKEELQEIETCYGSSEEIWPTRKKDCAKIKKAHYYARTPDKPEINSYAAPVLGSNDTLLGAIGCYAPLYRCTKAKELLIKTNIIKTAKTISLILS